MTGFTIERHIDVAPDLVFSVASDFPRAAEHVRGIRRVEMLTPAPVGEGTRFRETREVFNREATEEMEVLEWDPPRSYVLGAETHGCRYRTRVRCEPERDGTRVVMEFEARPLGFVAKVLSVLTRPMIKLARKAMAADLDDVAKAARERAGTAGPGPAPAAGGS